MIGEFKFCDHDNHEVEIGIGYSTDLYPIKTIRSDGGILRTHLPARVSKIKWQYVGSEIVIDNAFFAYPTVRSEYVVVMYEEDHPEYSAPNNAVIYHANGELHKAYKSRHVEK